MAVEHTRPSPARSFIVTIDGPAGVGKSTLAKRTAGALGVAYLDTGAMFRTLALGFSRRGIPASGPEAAAFLRDNAFSLTGCGEQTRLLCNGTLVGDEIRGEEAGLMAARIGKLPEVRSFLKEAQRALGRCFSLVAEGRDMGTEVFPDAPCKFFLDARPMVRAERRALQLRAMGLGADVGEIARQIAERDREDRERPIAPLRPAEDAVIIDTSDQDIEAVFQELMGFVLRCPHVPQGLGRP